MTRDQDPNIFHSPIPEEYVQPRYRQDRDEIVAQLEQILAGEDAGYPQVVDPTVLRIGDQLTIARSIEIKPLWSAVIESIEFDPVNNDAVIQLGASVQPPAAARVETLPPADTRSGVSLGLATLVTDGKDLPEKHFSYAVAFLTHTSETLAVTALEAALTPRQRYWRQREAELRANGWVYKS